MQGFNMGRYVPPEYEGTVSANKLAGKHALGNRARKAGQGILTVRFEMPFAIWCSTCTKPTIIGQGVRFNAEKKKVDNYYSTPIYSFRMKHNVCGGWIEIRTDPKNTAYVVTEGAKKRDVGEDKLQVGEIDVRTEEEKERLRNDAFAALEVKVDDKRQAQNDKTRIEELQELAEKNWNDPYAASRKLRKSFRVDRQMRQKNEALTEELKDRMSLGMDLLEETEADRKRAGFVEFGATEIDNAILAAKRRPLFTQETDKPLEHRDKPGSRRSKLRTLEEAERTRKTLRQELSNNTRAVLDPFLSAENPRANTMSSLSGVKRKRSYSQVPAAEIKHKAENESQLASLVDYESD